MKRLLALLTMAGLALTGCSAADSPAPAAATSASPSSSPRIPDVSGLTVREAGRVLDDAHVKWELVPMIPEGIKLNLEESESTTNEFVVDSQEQSVGYVPEQDVILVYASPAQSLIDNLAPWKITCRNDSYVDDSIEDVHRDLESVWKSKRFGEYTICQTEFVGSKFEPTKAQQEVIDIANVHWDGRETDDNAYATAMDVCTVPGAANLAGSENWGDVPEDWLKAGAALCPKAPFHEEMNRWATGQIVMPGNLTVGEDLRAGTYRSGKKTSDCYWARLTPGGDIIANKFVSYAAAGVTVTVRNGEVFESGDSCGAWVKQ